MNNTYYLELVLNNTVHRILYSSKEEADAALAEIEPKMGHGRYHNNPETNRHRVKSPTGDIVVVLEHLISARVLDEAEYQRLSAFSNDVMVQQAAAINNTMIPVMAALLHKQSAPQPPVLHTDDVHYAGREFDQ